MNILYGFYLGGILGTMFAMFQYDDWKRFHYALIFPYIYYRMFYRKDW